MPHIDAQQDHWSESGGRMQFHALGSFAVVEQSEQRSPPLRSVLSAGANMTRLAFALTALFLVGCTRTWERVGAPDISGSNALASVSSFIATNGWDIYADTNFDIFWGDLEPKFYISGLPWKEWSGQSFQAFTRGGILYVLRSDAFHHDYYGVAYNPHTNRFPEWIRGFKPIGDHWYVWAQPEFWYSAKTDGRYE